MSLNEYMILIPNEPSSNAAVANSFSYQQVLEDSRQIKTPATYTTEEQEPMPESATLMEGGVAMAPLTMQVTNDIMETDMECLERVANGAPIVAANTLSKIQILFRRVMECSDTGEISIHWGEANAMKLDMLRLGRNERLEHLDVPFMRALESRNTQLQTLISQKKQILRDLPETITANLTSNTTIVNATMENRQTLIFEYEPPELKKAFLLDILSDS